VKDEMSRPEKDQLSLSSMRMRDSRSSMIGSEFLKSSEYWNFFWFSELMEREE
jgi:hypothetical protein